MPSTNSPNKNYELQATGENQGTWGVLLNNNALSIVDLNLGGRLAVTIDSANVDLTSTQAQNVYITLTGTLTGNRDLTFPATNGGFYYILNSTSGAFTVTVKPLGGTGVVIPQGALSRVFINPTATTAVHLGIPATATGTAILPISSDGTALGSTSLMMSDLFLASGGVINWNAGDVTITHSANTLAFAGASSGYTFDVPIAIASGGTGASSASAARTALGLIIGTDVQAFNSNLLTIAGLTATTDNFMVATSSAWASRTPTQARSQMGLGSAATVNTGTSGATIPLCSTQITWSNGVVYDSGTSGASHFFIRDGAGSTSATTMRVQRTDSTETTGSELIDFFGPSVQIGSITAIDSGGPASWDSVAYNTTSDGRRKPVEYRRWISNSGDIIDRLNPVYFRWDSGGESFGFIAQEVNDIVPGIVKVGDYDPTKKPGEEGYVGWEMQYGRMEAILVAELKSLRHRVSDLEGFLVTR
jgi:hypothetical protein